MKDFKFWSQWPKAYQIFYFVLFFVFAVLLVHYFVSYNLGIRNILSWSTDTTLQNVKHPLRNFSVGLFNINVPAYSYVIEELFVPTSLKTKVEYAHSFILIIFFCLAVFNSVITVLNRTYFLAGIAILIFTFLVMKFDILGLFGIYENYIPAGFLILISAISYYFHAFKPDLNFFTRLLSFTSIYAVILLITFFFSKENLPLVSLAQHAILFTGIISLIFILIVSHELIYGFLFLVTFSARPGSKNTILHFVFVSLLYFACLLMLYLKIMGFSDFEIFGTDAFLILPFSILIGIYGLKARENNYKNFINFHPYGAFLYFILAIITFATIGYFFATYNDPAIEAFQDFIIFLHIGVGLIFFIYVFANFGSLLKKSLPIYKIVYKPEKLPFYFVRLAGLLIAGVLLVRSNYLSLSQSVSAYMIGMGDYASLKNNSPVAKQYYLLSKNYDHYNFKANYALGEIFLDENKSTEAAYHFQETFFRNPTPQGYIKLSDIALRNDLYFDAIFALKEGLNQLPNQGYLYNNLALLYNRTAFIDSAYIFLNSARQSTNDHKVVNSNYWGFLGRNNSLFISTADSIINAERNPDYAAGINNKLAFLNSLSKKSTEELHPNRLDSAFDEKDFSILNNYILNILPDQSKKIDSSTVKAIDHLIKKRSETSYGENLSLLKAIYIYNHGNVRDAMVILERLAKEGTTNTGYFTLLLGLWCMENNAFRLSVDYFNLALEKGNKDAFLYKAIALSETGDKAAAIQAWENVIQLNEPSVADLATVNKAILGETNFNNFFGLKDEYKYYAIRYRYNELTPEQKEGLIQNLEDEKIRCSAQLLDAQNAFEQRDFEKMDVILRRLKEKNALTTAQQRQLHELTLAYAIERNEDGEKLLNSAKSLNTNKQNYFFATIYKKLGKKKEAESQYQKAILALPLDFMVVSDAVAFYNNKNDLEAAYNISLDASKINPYSAPLLKLYILQSLKVNLFNYAKDGMEKLAEITSEKEFLEFKEIFELENKKQESSDAGWQ